MKGIVRSVEAMLAIMLLFVSLSSFFRIEVEGEAPILRYQRLVEETLDTYGETYKFLVFQRPERVDAFTRTVIPAYVNFRAEVEYVQPLDLFYGANETDLPVTFYVDYPPGTDANTLSVSDGRVPVPFQTEFNWFRIPFFVDNDATPRTDHWVNFTARLEFRDTNLDGEVEPPDPNSIDLFYESSRPEFGWEVEEIGDDYVDVALSFQTDLEANELASGYLYYMVGDIYEG